jgi:hypothetical protein
LRDGGERRLRPRGGVDAVEADDGQVLENPELALVREGASFAG